MEANIIKQDGLVRVMSLTLSAEELERSINNKISQLKQKVSVAGFRPGKVPPDIIRQQYAKTLLDEASSELMRDHFLKTVVEQDINLAGVRVMEPKQLSFGKDFIFEVSYEIFPQVKINTSPTTKIERIVAEVSDSDLDAMIDKMRQSKASLVDAIVGIAATRDHVVTIDYESETDGTKQPMVKDVVVDLAGSFPSSRFIDALVGMKEGDSKSFSDQLPAADNKEQQVVFDIKVNKIQRKQLPELDTHFFRQYGVENESDLRDQVKKNMEFELHSSVKRLMRGRVYDLLLAEHKDLTVPETRVNSEAQRLRDQVVKELQQKTGTTDKVDEEKLPLSMFTEEAQRVVKVGLLLVELARRYEVNIGDEQVTKRIGEIAATYQEPARVEEYYRNNKQLQEHIKNDLLEEKTIEIFLTNIKVEDKAVSYQQVMQMINPNAKQT